MTIWTSPNYEELWILGFNDLLLHAGVRGGTRLAKRTNQVESLILRTSLAGIGWGEFAVECNCI